VTESIRGTCLCGGVTFEIEPPFQWVAHCHCSMCRKQHGSLFGTGLGVERSHFRWTKGETDVVHYSATPAFERPFCRRCGSTVPGVSHLPDVMLVPAGLLDGDFAMKPRAHIFAASKSPLQPITDSLPQFAGYPPGVDLPVVALERPLSRRGLVVGSCLCGAVGYEVNDKPRRVVHCHCSLCRRSRGAPFASTLFTHSDKFRWQRGAEHVRTYRLAPPRTYETDFCARCGSLTPTVSPDVGLALIPAGSIDTPLGPLPGVHIYVASKARWHEITDSAPQFAEMPPPDRFGEFFM
jgi:hypothetical protein